MSDVIAGEKHYFIYLALIVSLGVHVFLLSKLFTQHFLQTQHINSGIMVAPVSVSINLQQLTLTSPQPASPKVRPHFHRVKADRLKARHEGQVKAAVVAQKHVMKHVVKKVEKKTQKQSLRHSTSQSVTQKSEFEGVSSSDLHVMKKAVFLSPPVPPAYPELARQLGEEGKVLVSAEVSISGNLIDVRVTRSSGFSLLDRAALDTVRQWRLKPMVINGKAVASQVTFPIRFNLNR